MKDEEFFERAASAARGGPGTANEIFELLFDVSCSANQREQGLALCKEMEEMKIKDGRDGMLSSKAIAGAILSTVKIKRRDLGPEDAYNLVRVIMEQYLCMRAAYIELSKKFSALNNAASEKEDV